MKVLIAGGSGMLGKKLSTILISQGHEVAWLSRQKSNHAATIRLFHWNPEKFFIEDEGIHWPEAIINLAGASIGETKWTLSGKEEILRSRTKSVQTLTNCFRKREEPLQAFCGISGAGYYGKGDFAFKETDAPGKDFPARVAKEWEDCYMQFNSQCKPKHFSIIRMSVVLAAEGGAFPKIAQPIRLGIGADLGNGKQPINWIHIADACSILSESLNWDGIFNASAPEQTNNHKLTIAIANILNKRIIMPAVPAFALRLVLGDRASLILEGNHSDVSKLIKQGFKFSYPDLNSALIQILST
jgi:uncharacterized protein (TIGR01777 family)